MTTFLVLAGVLGVAVVVVAFLVWLVRFIFGRRKILGRVFKKAGIVYLVLLPLFVWGLVPLLFSYLILHSGTRPPDLRLSETPSDLGCTFQEASFKSRDDHSLSGWYLPGQQDQPAFSISHGLFRNRHEVQKRACDLNQRGYPVLIFDFRAHGSAQGTSERAYVTMGYSERLDVLGAVDYLLEKGHQEIVLMGVSMGAVAVIQAAPEVTSHLKAVIADSPFYSLDETVSRHVRLFLGLPAFPFANVFAFGMRTMGGIPAGQPNSTQALAKLQGVPVLLIYGQDDRRMPEETARAVFEAVAGPRKELIFFEGARHGRAYDSAPRRYVDLIDAFLKDEAGAPAAGPASKAAG